MYLFSKKVKCAKCGGNFRGTTERGKRKYLCGTYHNYRTCIRYKVDEEFLFDIAKQHYEIKMISDGIGLGGVKKGKSSIEIDPKNILEFVEYIRVDPENETLTVFYKDSSSTLISPNRHIY